MRAIPLPTILIAIAMFCFSILIVSRLGSKIPLTRLRWTILVVSGIVFLGAGLFLHLGAKPAEQKAVATAHKGETHAARAFTFTFAPREARWGQQVEIQVPPPADSVTVYLNGMPLPKKVSGDGRMVSVTIPTTAKSGYIELERDGARVRAEEEIRIIP